MVHVDISLSEVTRVMEILVQKVEKLDYNFWKMQGERGMVNEVRLEQRVVSNHTREIELVGPSKSGGLKIETKRGTDVTER